MLIIHISDEYHKPEGVQANRFTHTAKILSRNVNYINALNIGSDIVMNTVYFMNDVVLELYMQSWQLVSLLKSALFIVTGNHDYKKSVRKNSPRYNYFNYTLEAEGNVNIEGFI